MRVTETDLPGVLVLEPTLHRDDRGWFMETWNAREWERAGLPTGFVQDNHSRSSRGTLRGLHAQSRRPQGKLVRVLVGEVFDVAVDIRRGSPNFGQWTVVRLSAENRRQCWIPPGFAHGFCVLSEEAEFEYKCTDFYDPAGEIRLRWDDPAIGVAWPVSNPSLSPKDEAASMLADLTSLLPEFRAQDSIRDQARLDRAA